ncbi:hypothetical protein HYY75_04585 [bacterium]|nr:hypothetical protein [bacterium]
MRVEAIMIIKKDGSFEIVRLTEGALAQVAKIVIPVIQDAIKKKFESRMRHEKEKFPVQENPQDKPKPE